MNTRLLFVDDEPAIRLTLPAILKREGFDVSVAATVPEALDLINREKFDALIADLNVGEPGDGFTVVSAMRRTQPDAVTFILTGFPDFQSALEAIRRQVDDYMTKPADIRKLVTTIKEKLANPRHIRNYPTKPVAAVIRENSNRIKEYWLAEAKNIEKLRATNLSDERLIDHLPWLLESLAHTLETDTQAANDEDALDAATEHGAQRAKDGYDAPMLVKEAGILHKALSAVLQESLLEIDPSSLVGDTMKIGEKLNQLLEQSIRSYQKQTRQAA